MMNKSQMTEIVTMCSALDGQQVTDSKVAMWVQVLDGCTYEECVDAIVPAYRECSNGIVGAKDVWEQVMGSRSQPKALDDESGWSSDPQPVCEDHGLRILGCDECCVLIHHEAGWMGVDDRHSWAMGNVYRARGAWV
jgi:hypothetical protein